MGDNTLLGADDEGLEPECPCGKCTTADNEGVAPECPRSKEHDADAEDHESEQPSSKSRCGAHRDRFGAILRMAAAGLAAAASLAELLRYFLN